MQKRMQKEKTMVSELQIWWNVRSVRLGRGIYTFVTCGVGLLDEALRRPLKGIAKLMVEGGIA